MNVSVHTSHMQPADTNRFVVASEQEADVVTRFREASAVVASNGTCADHSDALLVTHRASSPHRIVAHAHVPASMRSGAWSDMLLHRAACIRHRGMAVAVGGGGAP